MERCPSWPKEHDWKSCIRQKRIRGSNPRLSARNKRVIGFLLKLVYILIKEDQRRGFEPPNTVFAGKRYRV